MSTSVASYELRVRDGSGRIHRVAVRPIRALGLAVQIAQLLAQFLAEEEEYASGPRFAWELREELVAAGVELEACVVEVVRRTGRRKRVIAEFPAAPEPAVAGKILAR